MSAITAKASRKMKKYAVLTREPRCFLGSFDFSWEQRKLGEIGSVSMCRRIFKEQTSETGDIPFYKIGTFGADPDAFISRELFEEYKSKYPYPQKGDILISASGSIGRTVEFAGNNEYFQDSNIVWLNHDERLSNPFLKCFYSVVKWAGIEGSTIKRLYNDNILNTVICMPSVPEQKRIGLFFENLDNLITLHQRKCANLCSPSQVVFSLLFATSTFSWEQRKVSDLAEKTYGGGTPTTSNEAYWNGDIPWIQSSDVVDGKLLGVEPRKWITQDGLNNSAAQLIPGNSIAIITRVGVGKLAFMPYSYATSQDFLSLSKLNAEPLFTVYACYKKLQSELNAVQGTSIKGITKDELLAKNIMVPRYAEQQQIGAFFKQLDHLITLHQRECISFTGRADRLILTANKKRTTSSWEQRKLGDIASDMVAGGDIDKDLILAEGQYPVIANALTGDGIVGYYDKEYRVNAPAVTVTGRGDVGHAKARLVNFTPVVRLLSVKSEHDVFFLENAINTLKIVIESTGVPQLTVPQLAKYEVAFPRQLDEEEHIGAFFKQLDHLITLHQRKPFLMKWRTSDANRNQTNRLVL